MIKKIFRHFPRKEKQHITLFFIILCDLVKQFICDQQMFLCLGEEKATNFFLLFYSTVNERPFKEKRT